MNINDLSQPAPLYASRLSWMPDHLGLKTIRTDDGEEVVIVTANGGIQLICAACDAPFTVEEWCERHWHIDGNIYHERCCDEDGDYRTVRGGA